MSEETGLTMKDEFAMSPDHRAWQSHWGKKLHSP